MNVTLLSTICVLSVLGGVYSSMVGQVDQTRVDVTIFAPRHFLGNSTRIFLNYNLDTDVIDTVTVDQAKVFDVQHPLIDPDTSIGACANLSCDHTCDEGTGLCACLKGYKGLGPSKCVDVNECMEGKVRCDAAAGCYNRKGSYDCICGEDFYGNGKTCRECERPCPDKHFEVQPCAPEIQKICKACTQTCRPGHFMAQHCRTKENAICRVCRPECQPGEFESRQCSTHHDRECMKSTVLQQPLTSDNLILEGRSHVTDSSTRLEPVPSHYVGFTNYKLHRGTGVYIDLTVRFIDAQQFMPVSSSQASGFSLNHLAPSVLRERNVRKYCPDPFPDYYTLRYRKREGITYKQINGGHIEPCDSDGDFDTSTSGAGAGGFGGGASFSTSQSASFACVQPGGLTDIFSVEEDFFLARTKWVDKSKRCQRNSRTCETCIRTCGSSMTSDPECKVTGEDSDNGLSPRLVMCYNCCVKKNCSNTCQDYHKSKCQPQQCTKGNLLEFSLQPSWDSSQEGKFFCHIQPLPRQYLLNLDYSIKVKGRGGGHGRALELRKKKILIYGDEEWVRTGLMKFTDGILNISIDSSLGSPPDVLEGDTTVDTTFFRVGHYKSKGTRFGNSYIQSDFAFLRPTTPHGVPTMPQAKEDCTHAPMEDMLLTSNMENPYTRQPNLQARSNNASLPFTIKNKGALPVVIATVSRDTPVLKKLYSPVRMREESFRGDVTHNGSHWVVEISGEVVTCPGYLHIQVCDPTKPTEFLFDCDTVINCPPTFNLTFALPTSDLEGMYKDVLVLVTDSKHEHNLRLFRRTSLEEELEEVDVTNEWENLKDQSFDIPQAQAMQDLRGMDADGTKKDDPSAEVQSSPNFPLPIYVLLIIVGGVLLLLVLAIIGQCFMADFPIPDTPYAQVHHAFFAVVYVLLQFIYSLFISGTAFFLILTIITNWDVNFIMRHGKPGAVSTAASNIELLRLQRHLEGEITRQDTLADAAQEMCIKDVDKISADMRRIHDNLLNSTQDVFERHRLDLLLTQQKLHVRQKLSKDLRKFRESYAKAARAVLKQVNQNAQASYQNVASNNIWLDSARYLHDLITADRKMYRKPVKTFMEWTGIRGQLEKLEIDLTFALPALPRLDDIPAPPPPRQPIKRDSGPQFPELDPIKSIQMHNNWFFPTEEMGIGGAVSFGTLKLDGDRDSQTDQSSTSVAFYVFLVLLALCDLILLGHRMCRAWTTAKLCVYGFPEYFRENKEMEMGNDDVFASRESKLTPAQGCRDSPYYQSVALFFTQTISTTFFPKIVGAIASCVVMVCLLQLSNQCLTVKELERAGLYHSADEYLDLQASLTNARLTGHAEQINLMHFPAFQASVSGHVARHQAVLSVYRKQLLGLQSLSMEMYCQHLQTIDMETNCSQISEQVGMEDSEAWHKMTSVVHACKFYPVVPRLYIRGEDKRNPTPKVQTEAVLDSVRNIVFLTARLATIFICTVVVKELLCAVVWIFLQRSGAIRIRVIVERDQDESQQ